MDGSLAPFASALHPATRNARVVANSIVSSATPDRAKQSSTAAVTRLLMGVRASAHGLLLSMVG